VIAGIETLWRGEAHIVGIQGIRHDQMVVGFALAILLAGPERQIVSIVITVVKKAALVENQTPGIGAVTAGVPTLWLFTVERLEYLDGALHMIALDTLRHALVVQPAPTVTGDLVAQLLE